MGAQASIGDRLDVQDVITRYAIALDTRRPDQLDEVFLPDARLDYRSIGGPLDAYPAVRAWLEAAMARFDSWQHLLGNFAIAVDGDRATARTDLYNPLVGPEGVLHTGAVYEDELARTSDGWRIAARTVHLTWMDGPLPDGAAPPPTP